MSKSKKQSFAPKPAGFNSDSSQPKLLVLQAVSRADMGVSRSLIVPTTSTFIDLHNALTEAFEFGGEQYASFYLHDEDNPKGYLQIALFDTDEEFSAKRTMFDTAIGDYLQEKGQAFLYIYDFILMWEFEVEVAEVLPKEIVGPLLISSVGTLPEKYGHMEEYPVDEDGDDDESDDDDDDDEDSALLKSGKKVSGNFSGSSLDIEGDDSLMDGWDDETTQWGGGIAD